MGERHQRTLFRPEFNRSARVEAADEALSEDAGALVVREMMARLGIDGAVRDHLVDRRDQRLLTYSLPELVRTSVVLLAQGWVDQDDADALRHDQVLRMAITDRRGATAVERPLPSQPTLSRLVSELGADVNHDGVGKVVLQSAVQSIQALHGHRKEMVVDFDSYPDEAHGRQEGAAYNAHYHMTCLHPLLAIADTGHMLGGRMRPGNVHTANDIVSFAGPVFEAVRPLADQLWARIDAGFILPEFMDWLDARRIRFVGRLRSNPRLEREVERWLERQRAEWAARPSDTPRESTHEFYYRAKSWSRCRRVVAVLVERTEGDGELFDRHFFLITNAARTEATSAGLLARYRQRGTAENHIGEFVNVIRTKISSHALRDNDVMLLLGQIAYNVTHHIRERLARHLGTGVSLARLRERFLKAASLVIHHARRLIVRVAREKVEAWRQLVAALDLVPAAGTTEGLSAT